jgi:hypothetical protein
MAYEKKVTAVNTNRAIAVKKLTPELAKKYPTLQAIVDRTELLDTIYSNGILKADVDYGRIPGTPKDTLFKPGAENLLMFFNMVAECEPNEMIDKSDYAVGAYDFLAVCRGYEISERTGFQKVFKGMCIGACSSRETKYRYRWVTKDKISELDRFKYDKTADQAVNIEASKQAMAYWKQEKGDAAVKYAKGLGGKMTVLYRIENENPYDLINTIIQMAQKRALVGMTKVVTGVDRIFTDVEDVEKEQADPVDVDETEPAEPTPVQAEVIEPEPPPKVEPKPKASKIQPDKDKEMDNAWFIHEVTGLAKALKWDNTALGKYCSDGKYPGCKSVTELTLYQRKDLIKKLADLQTKQNEGAQGNLV